MSAPEFNANGAGTGGQSGEDVVFIEDAGPNEGLVFQVDPNTGRGEYIQTFTPEFYPDRFNKSISKDLNRDEKQCKGEDVSIKQLKNAELHASGVMLANEVGNFQKVVKHRGTVDLISPISPNGGIECYIKKAELGEMKGYDPKSEEWKVSYTLDFVGTGKDEYGENDQSAIVTDLLSDNQNNLLETGAQEIIDFYEDNFEDDE